MMATNNNGSFLMAVVSFAKENPVLVSCGQGVVFGLYLFCLYRQIAPSIKAEIKKARALAKAKESYLASLQQENEDLEVFFTLFYEQADAMREQADKSRGLLALIHSPSSGVGLPRFFTPPSVPEHTAEGLSELINQCPRLSSPLSGASCEEIDAVLTQRHDHREAVFSYAEALFGKTHEEIEALIKANAALRQQHVATRTLKRNLSTKE